MSISTSERLFLLAALLIYAATQLYALTTDAQDTKCALMFVGVALVFWSCALHGLAALSRGFVARLEHRATKNSTAEATPANRLGMGRIFLGALLQAIAVLMLGYLHRSMTPCGARWFALTTIGYVFTGSTLMLVFAAFNNKNKQL